MTLSGRILYLDDVLIAIDKPAGMPTHPGPGCRDVTSLLQAARNHLGAWVYPVHRLDRGASGVTVLARSPEVAALLAKGFASREVTKTYRALVRGWLVGEGVIDRPLGRLNSDDTQSAASRYRGLATFSAPWPARAFPTSRYSLVEMQPITGRTHQLRRHLAGVSHPIIGDTKYGDGVHNAAFRQFCKSQRLLLHACSLQLFHPASREPLLITAPTPPLFDGEIMAALVQQSKNLLSLTPAKDS
jgi:tRNA pseudouridine65 synthase